MKLRSLLLVVASIVAVAFSCGRAEIKQADKEKIDAALPTTAPATPKQARKVLIYTQAAGYVHSSIPDGAYAIQAMGTKTGAYASVISDDPAMFDADKLAGFDAIVLVSTTADFLLPRTTKQPGSAEVLKQYQEALPQRQQNLLDFVNDGKGVMGIHAATDAFYKWAAYGDLMGGYFDGHPWHEKVGIKIDDPDHPCNTCFGKKGFNIVDEIYQFKADPWSREKLRVLTSLDVSKDSVTARKPKSEKRADEDFGVSWLREAGKGRVFYCSLGHREEIYWNPVVLQHYLAGIQFALGDLKVDTTPSAKLDAQPIAAPSPRKSDEPAKKEIPRARENLQP